MNAGTRTTVWLLVLAIVLSLLSPMAMAAVYKNGFYDASALGKNGDVNVHVVIDSGEIIKITTTHGEDTERGGLAIEGLIRQALSIQSASLDAVAGATISSNAFIHALKEALAEAGGLDEGDAADTEALPEVHIITRRTPEPTPEPAPQVTPEPVASVMAPEIEFNNVRSEEGGICYIDGDIVVANWHTDGEVEEYQVLISDASGAVVKRIDTSDTQYVITKGMLAEGEVYTLTITAIPKNGTLEQDGETSVAQFSVSFESQLLQTPEPMPEPIAEPEVMPIPAGLLESYYRPLLRVDGMSYDQARDKDYDPFVLGNDRVVRSQIESIEFVDGLDGVEDGAWDVSAAGNGSAMAWVSGEKLFIAGLGGVTAPVNASYLFAKYKNLKSIAFNGCFYTGYTESMSGMFYGCQKLKSLDLSTFSTGSVTNMSYMFYGCKKLASLDLTGRGTTRQLHSAFNSHDALVGLEESGFVTGNTTDMRGMFTKCDALSEITVSDGFAMVELDEEHVADMFDGCPASIRLNGASLKSDSWKAQVSLAPGLAKGNKGDQVKWMQRILRDTGCLSGSADGDFGPMTETALKSFQADAGLEQSGVADTATLRALCVSAARMSVEQPRVGDIMSYGSYEQDGDTANGSEPIEWVVLETDGNKATLMSLYGLDAVRYNSEDKDVTWESSSLRTWLNGDFMKTAFTEKEQKRLETITASADANPEYDTKAGKDSKDKVMLPSIAQLNKWFDGKWDWTCTATQQAIINGAVVNEITGNSTWWLRTPGSAANLAVRVNENGEYDYQGGYVQETGAVIRPVITISLVEESTAKTTSTGTGKKKKKKGGGSGGGSGSGSGGGSGKGSGSGGGV